MIQGQSIPLPHPSSLLVTNFSDDSAAAALLSSRTKIASSGHLYGNPFPSNTTNTQIIIAFAQQKPISWLYDINHEPTLPFCFLSTLHHSFVALSLLPLFYTLSLHHHHDCPIGALFLVSVSSFGTLPLFLSSLCTYRFVGRIQSSFSENTRFAVICLTATGNWYSLSLAIKHMLLDHSESYFLPLPLP